MNEGDISTSITAGHIRATGQITITGRHQLRMGWRVFIHIDPETAKQWADVLTKIAEESA